MGLHSYPHQQQCIIPMWPSRMLFLLISVISSTNSFIISYIMLLPPATKLCQGNVFTPVCNSLPRGSATPLGRPPRQTHTPWANTPPGQTPPTQCMLGYTPRPVHAGIRLTSGQYASYWNSLLFLSLNLVIGPPPSKQNSKGHQGTIYR